VNGKAGKFEPFDHVIGFSGLAIIPCYDDSGFNK
jgi:hypothetical protein